MADNHLDNIIVKHYAGSHAYGTNLPTSDVDFRGLFIADKKFILSPFFNVKEVTDIREEDTKFFEISNYIGLYLDANPNILETLWVDKSDIIFSTDYYEKIRSHRSDMLSTKIAFTYTGYAHNQVTRMTNHRGWMDKERTAIDYLQTLVDNNPCEQIVDWMNDSFPDYILNQLNFSSCFNRHIKSRLPIEKYLMHESVQMVYNHNIDQQYFVRLVHNYFEDKLLDRDFTISNFNYGYRLVPYGSNLFGLIKGTDNDTCINEDGSLHINKSMSVEELKKPPLLIVKFNKENYELSNDNRKNYHRWKRERNKARSELEKKYLYDTKHASHVIRLLHTAEEALSTGEVYVKRPDASLLLDIRNGKWTYDEIMEYYNEKSTYIREVLYNNSTLPKKPNIKLAAKLLEELYEMFWYGDRLKNV